MRHSRDMEDRANQQGPKMSKHDDDEPKVVDSEGLTDSDWSEIGKLQRALKSGGGKAFWDAVEKLGKRDPFIQVRVAYAFFPKESRHGGLVLSDARAAGIEACVLRF